MASQSSPQGVARTGLDELKAEMEKEGGAPIYPLVFDVREKEGMKAIETLPEEWKKISILVNNAGNAHGLSPVQSGSTDDWDAMIDINVKGLLYVSKAVIPLMPEGDAGSIIINVGSIAGKEAYPQGNVYCCTKAAVDQLTKCMRLDLYQQGIRVAALHPGLVETEFSLVRFKGDKERADKVYQNLRPLTAEDCADTLLYMATRPAHVNVADVLLLPTDQVHHVLPDKSPSSRRLPGM
eukprot:Sspe_Gene.2834::Locus_942_Transcript_2_2_Confidence_0.750_Length_866::g.2834::m.2834